MQDFKTIEQGTVSVEGGRDAPELCGAYQAGCAQGHDRGGGGIRLRGEKRSGIHSNSRLNSSCTKSAACAKTPDSSTACNATRGAV